MFRLLSGHEWSVGGEAREGEREREREGIFSERKQKWDIHRGPSPLPSSPSVGRTEDAAMRKVAPQEAGNATTTSDEQAPPPLLLHLLSVGGFNQACGYWVMDWKGLLKHWMELRWVA